MLDTWNRINFLFNINPVWGHSPYGGSGLITHTLGGDAAVLWDGVNRSKLVNGREVCLEVILMQA